MAIQATTTDGVTYSLPETGDTDWTDVTPALAHLVEGALLSGAPVVGPQIVTPTNTLVLADGATLNPGNKSVYVISGDGADVSLDPTTPIAAGSTDGAHLYLIGDLGTNSVTIPDTGNVDINGEITVEPKQVIHLYWVSAFNTWIEFSRNN